MASLKADHPIVVIRNDLGQTSGTTRITYEKAWAEEFWINENNSGWSQVEDLSSLDPGAASPRFSGSFEISIEAGKTYEAGIFAALAGPPDPQQQAGVKVFGVLKQPEKKKLIVESGQEAGGTFVNQFIQTSETTTVARIGCKRGAFDFDADGLPVFDDAEGVTWLMHHPSTGHNLFVLPLLPGNNYELQAVVVDDFGNWDVLRTEFRTQSRKFTVQFTTLHIYNDSDPGGHGEAEFSFTVMFGTPPTPTQKIQEFHLPERDIDDWGETDRPYPVGFAHIGDFLTVAEDERDIYVRSIGNEFDGLDPDEGAWSVGGRIQFPVGLGESVPRRQFRLDARPSTKGSDFHYGVDVVWSVEYDFRP